MILSELKLREQPLISAFEIDKTLQNSRNELMQFKVQEAQTKQRLQAAQVELQTLSQAKE